MINVLFVTDTLRLRFGVTMVIRNLIMNSDSNNINFNILAYDDSEVSVVNSFTDNGVKVFFMPRLSMFSVKTFQNFLHYFFSNNKFDIVHSHFCQIDNLLFPIVRKYNSTVCISHSHSVKLSEFPLREVRNKFMCVNLYKRADYCAACSEKAGRALYGRKFTSSSKKIIIKNGIKCDDFRYNVLKRSQIRNSMSINDTQIVLGHIGSFKPVKNHRFLIETLYQLRKISDRYILLLVGDGELKQQVVQQAKELGILEFVRFVGVTSNIPDYLSAFDVFVMPSLHEGLGIAAVEAQANGLNCILSDSIPHDVLLTDGVRFVGLNKGVEEWVKAICESSYDHNEDYNLQVRLKGYDINDVCKSLESFYSSIIANQHKDEL